MGKSFDKTYVVLVSINAKNVKDALKRFAEGEVEGVLHRVQDVRELASLVGFEAAGQAYCDEEHTPEETRKLGF